MKKHDHTGRSLRAEILTTASPEQIWQAWSEPDKIAHWFVDRAEGRIVEGGTVTWFFDAFGIAVPIPVIEAIPGARFAFAAQRPSGRLGIMEVTIEHRGGETRMTLVESGFADGSDWDEEYEGVASGWAMAVEQLRWYAERNFGRAPVRIFELAPTGRDRHEALAAFSSSEGLSRWLAADARTSAPGGRWNATFGGRSLSGTVLCRTRMEVMLGCDEIDGCIGLKSFATPKGRVVAISVNAWNLADRDALARDLRAALARLAAG